MTADPTPQIPDPNGPPTSDRAEEILRHAASIGIKVLLGGATAFLVLAVMPSRTMGALRSQRIKWQQRHDEIAQIQAQLSAETQPAPEAQSHD